MCRLVTNGLIQSFTDKLMPCDEIRNRFLISSPRQTNFFMGLDGGKVKKTSRSRIITYAQYFLIVVTFTNFREKN
jgi:hypothetical protein